MSERKAARYGRGKLAGNLLAAGLLLAGAQAAKTGHVAVVHTHLGGQTGVVQDMVSLVATFQMVEDTAGGAPSSAASGADGGRPPDSCFVLLQDGKTLPSGLVAPAGTVPAAPAARPSALDAGDPLTLNTASTPYANFVRHSGQNGPSYRAEKPSAGGLGGFLAAAADMMTGGGLFGLPPSGAVLNIPGAAGPGGFPAFQNVALPVADPFVLTAPADRAALTPDTVFRWSGASNQPDASVMLTSTQEISSADGSKKTLLVLCTAKDDGEFSFPDATRADLLARGFTKGSLLFTSRTLSRKVVQDDATLTVSVQDMDLSGAGGH